MSGIEGSFRAPVARHERACGDRAAGGVELPALAGLVPVGLAEVAAEAHVGEQALALRDLFDVGLDLGLRREGGAPLRVEREREGVEVARHVTCATRVGVVAPGAPDALVALEDYEVGVPSTLQPTGHRQAGEAAADHGDLGLPRDVVLGNAHYRSVTYTDVS
jgi:hypothetical protein